jgi:hypothetical protein
MEEKREATKVGVAFHLNSVQFPVDLFRAGVIFRITETAITLLLVPVLFQKVIFREFEGDRDQDKQFANKSLVDMSA